jgi:hypothetical protein
MSPQEKKLAKYLRKSERQNNISLWFALAIVMVPVVGFGVFLTVANGLDGHTPPSAITHFAPASVNSAPVSMRPLGTLPAND